VQKYRDLCFQLVKCRTWFLCLKVWSFVNLLENTLTKNFYSCTGKRRRKRRLSTMKSHNEVVVHFIDWLSTRMLTIPNLASDQLFTSLSLLFLFLFSFSSFFFVLLLLLLLLSSFFSFHFKRLSRRVSYSLVFEDEPKRIKQSINQSQPLVARRHIIHSFWSGLFPNQPNRKKKESTQKHHDKCRWRRSERASCCCPSMVKMAKRWTSRERTHLDRSRGSSYWVSLLLLVWCWTGQHRFVGEPRRPLIRSIG